MANTNGFRLPLDDGFICVETLGNGRIMLSAGDEYFGITRIYVTVNELKEIVKSINAMVPK